MKNKKTETATVQRLPFLLITMPATPRTKIYRIVAVFKHCCSWRRERDSNPRSVISRTHDFQSCALDQLSHLSVPTCISYHILSQMSSLFYDFLSALFRRGSLRGISEKQSAGADVRAPLGAGAKKSQRDFFRKRLSFVRTFLIAAFEKKAPPQGLLPQYPVRLPRARQRSLRRKSATKTESGMSMEIANSRGRSGAVRRTLPPRYTNRI